MIILKIKDSGYTISIPGLTTVRSPVEIDISRVKIKPTILYLKSIGVLRYEIVEKNNILPDLSETKVMYKQGDDYLETGDRLDNIESMLKTLLENNNNDTDFKLSHITKKLEKIEDSIKNKRSYKIHEKMFQEKIEEDPEIEELESFIPDVDIDEMKIKSDVKSFKKDFQSAEEAADLLSLLRTKKGNN